MRKKRLKDNYTAIGYTYDDDKYVANSLSYQYTSGSAGIIATAKDMENLLLELMRKVIKFAVKMN